MNSTQIGSTKYTKFYDKLAQVNLSVVRQQLAQTEGWAGHQLEQAMMRYQQFLFLAQQYPHQELVPDQETDLVLHTHLTTEQFAQDCQTLFGTQLTHENGFGTRGEADRLSWLEVFNHTKELIKQQFNWAKLDALQPASCVVRLTL